jgi:hypothetical protein
MLSDHQKIKLKYSGTGKGISKFLELEKFSFLCTVSHDWKEIEIAISGISNEPQWKPAYENLGWEQSDVGVTV